MFISGSKKLDIVSDYPLVFMKANIVNKITTFQDGDESDILIGALGALSLTGKDHKILMVILS